jgi:hypothetical protein
MGASSCCLLLALATAGLALLGGGAYTLVRTDASYDRTADATIRQRRLLGGDRYDCLYDYELEVGGAAYPGSYVASDMCLHRGPSVRVKYSSEAPARNCATVFGSYPPRHLEGPEVAGAALVAAGSALLLIAIVAAAGATSRSVHICQDYYPLPRSPPPLPPGAS